MAARASALLGIPRFVDACGGVAPSDCVVAGEIVGTGSGSDACTEGVAACVVGFGVAGVGVVGAVAVAVGFDGL